MEPPGVLKRYGCALRVCSRSSSPAKDSHRHSNTDMPLNVPHCNVYILGVLQWNPTGKPWFTRRKKKSHAIIKSMRKPQNHQKQQKAVCRGRYVLPCSTCKQECSIVSILPPAGLVCSACRESPTPVAAGAQFMGNIVPAQPTETKVGQAQAPASPDSSGASSSSPSPSSSEEEGGGSKTTRSKSKRMMQTINGNTGLINPRRRVRRDYEAYGCKHRDLPKAKGIATQKERSEAVANTKTCKSRALNLFS